MVISYRAVGSSAGYVTLFDMTRGDTLEPWNPQYRANVQVNDLASNTLPGASQKIKMQGNIVCQLPLHNMTITYLDAQTALAASRTIPGTLLNNQVNLRVVEGSETQYFPNAVCHSILPNVQGASVTFSMEFTTQMVTNVEPA